MVTIIDDFLEPGLHNWMCQGIIEERNFPWYFQPSTVSEPDETPQNLVATDYPKYIGIQSSFNHLMYIDSRLNGEGIWGNCSYLLDPLIDKLGGRDKISRLKINTVVKQPEHILQGWHRDQPLDAPELDNHGLKIAIYYLNTTNGYTLLEDGTKVSSVANRLVKFDNILHTCVTQTDEYRRVTVNINYY